MSLSDNEHALVRDYAELVAQKKALEAVIKTMGEDVRPLLLGRGAYVVDNFLVECKQQPGRKTLDKKALEEAGVDVGAYQKVGAPFTTMTVKEVNK